MKTALIIVDIQKDFLSGGALSVPDGDAIIQPIILAARSCELVIATADRHEANDNSFVEQGGPWPPHCVRGTTGQQIHPKIRKLANYTISKGMDPDGPEDYSAFTGHTLRPVHTLKELLAKEGIQTVVVVGLTLDWCVKFTALDANALGYRTIVPLECTRALDEKGRVRALQDFQRAGVVVQGERRSE
jgi:nicotinamidase/pyrazinamidase